MCRPEEIAIFMRDELWIVYARSKMHTCKTEAFKLVSIF